MGHSGQQCHNSSELKHDELEQLRREVKLLRSRIDVALPTMKAPAPEPANADSTLTQSNARLIAKIQRILRFRDMRRSVFSEDLFADPAWDMLMEIFVSDLKQQRTPVSAACLCARVPATTGLRWLKILESRGLVVRTNDPSDARRVFISLTAEAFTKMRILVESREFEMI